MRIRKVIPAVAAVFAAIALGGCGPQGVPANQYQLLNEKLKKHYSEVVLTVKSDFGDGLYLVSEYKMKFQGDEMTVNYSVERFNALSLDEISSQKTTLTGEASIENGTVSYLSGDEVGLGAVEKGVGLTIDEEYFENPVWTESSFQADVKDPKGFMGFELACTDMKADVAFSEAVSRIGVTYTAENASRVSYSYVFTP